MNAADGTGTSTLAGRVILVTGASSGAGAAIATALAAEGAVVVAAARRTERINALAERIARTGGAALAIPLDILDDVAVGRAVERIGARYGLVNCAGVLGKGAAGDADTSGWRRSIETNLYAPILVTHACMPLLRARPEAHIVNISSTATMNINPGWVPYVAAKAGLNGLTESLRKELAPLGIRMTLVSPGLIESEFFDRGGAGLRRPYAADIRALQPADIARVVVFALAQPAHVSINEIVVRPTDLPAGSAAPRPGQPAR